MSQGSRYAAQICMFFALFTLPVIAQINNESISLSGGTLTYQQITNNYTCTVAAKRTYTYTRYTDDSFVFHPNGGFQISIPGIFSIVTGSPGRLYESNCPANGGTGRPLTLLQQNYQVYIYAGGAINAAYVTGTFGYVNPKYVVSTVLYAPPGSKSTAVYTNSKTVGSSTSVSSTFTSSTTESVSTTSALLGAGLTNVTSWVNGTETSTTSNTETQSSQSSNSVTLTVSTSDGVTVTGPPNGDYVGVDHDWDIIKVWINPVVLFTVYNTTVSGETQVAWWGYGSSALDPTAPIDIWGIPAGCLNGDFPQTQPPCAAPLQQFQRTWAVNQNWPSGQGPGLTQADLNNILAADPWVSARPTIQWVPAPAPTTRLQVSFSQISDSPT